MKATGTWRGQPLAAMALVLATWIAVRALMWEAGIDRSPPVLPAAPPSAPARIAAVPAAHGVPPQPAAGSVVAPATGLAGVPGTVHRHGSAAVIGRVAAAPRARSTPIPASPLGPVVGEVAQNAPMAGGLRPASAFAASPVFPAPPSPPPRPPRWSADAWLLLRDGGGAGLAGGGAPAMYGASQAGAVLRFRLAPGDRHRAAVYARVTAALNGSGEKEGALGLSARPIAALPVIAAAELRVTEQPDGARLRPVAILFSEVPPIALPAGLRAEIYAQAGYVGGRYASAFADGQVRVDRSIAPVGRAGLRAGGGIWGGAQKGVSRVDLGPGATLALPLGDAASARLALDWRLRVAGNAAPASGPTLTLSAGF